jgi:hypothetical protein
MTPVANVPPRLEGARGVQDRNPNGVLSFLGKEADSGKEAKCWVSPGGPEATSPRETNIRESRL